MNVPPPTEAAVWQTLRQIIDPELGCNIVALGLVYEAVFVGRRVRVAMTLTSPGCPMGDILVAAAKSTLREIPGIEDAEVQTRLGSALERRPHVARGSGPARRSRGCVTRRPQPSLARKAGLICLLGRIA